MHKKSAFILLFSVAVLISIGLVMLFSAGAFASDGHGDLFSFLRKQGFWLGFGFVVAVVCATVDYGWWQRGWKATGQQWRQLRYGEDRNQN